MVYVLNRDAATNITISSPLEAHKSHNIVFSMVGLDMGFDNPVFAAIELDYTDADQVRTLSRIVLGFKFFITTLRNFFRVFYGRVPS